MELSKADKLEEEILGYFQQLSSKKTTLDCSINNDLALSGTEWDEVREHFIEKYHVDFDGLDYSSFFVGETRYYAYKKINPAYRKKPITIKHMVEVAKQQKWFDPNGVTPEYKIMQQILFYFQEYSAFNPVVPATVINDELRIWGKKWDMVRKDFEEDFGVDFSRLEDATYFAKSPNLINRLMGRKAVRKPVSVAHMIEVTKRKQWQEV